LEVKPNVAAVLLTCESRWEATVLASIILINYKLVQFQYF